ncbi:MAG TPA: hypothetical protein PKK60_01075 [archaeon]|nr:hypothetical protein [archaeon]
MKNGQISLDLLITILAIFVALSGLSLIGNDIKETQEDIFLQNQLKEQGNEISLLINTAQTLSDTNFYSKITLRKVIYKNTTFTPNFTIIDENTFEISENLTGKNIKSTHSSKIPKNLIIEKIENDMVIRNV